MKHLVLASGFVGMLLASSALAEVTLVPRIGFHGGSIKSEAQGVSVTENLAYELNYGLQVLYPIADATHLRGGLALGKVKGEDEEGDGTDRTAFDVGVEYSFISTDANRVYAAGLLTHNSLKPEEGDTVSNLNLDLGLGVDFKLADNVKIGGEFTLSPFALSSYSKNGVDVTFNFQELALFAAISL